MAIRLPFIDRIKTLSRGFINRDSLALNRPRSYEVEILPAPAARGSVQSGLPVARVIRPATPPRSAKADPLWPQEQESGRKVESTYSNLG